ncbi:hypothetical protein NL108_013876 [Boleophthalmus pectinirostris]|nr:hypothetical protein NL108_013876 [Boleophthalmus pectinirostris]
MEADLFVLKKKPSSAPVKSSGKDGPKKSATTLENTDKPGGEDKSSTDKKKPNSAPSSGRNYKNFTFSDGEDQLDDLLPEETKPKPKAVEKSVPSSPISPILKNKAQAPTKKRSDLTFDDNDDLMDTLGFDSDQSTAKKKDAKLRENKEMSDQPQRARTKLDDILQSLTSPHLLERPPTGEKKEHQQDKTSTLKEKQDEDLTFGSYQPTLVSTPEGRQSRRQSVRFSTEDVSTLDKKSKPSTPTRQRASDWLGLKANGDHIQDRSDQRTEPEKESPNLPAAAPSERKAPLSGPASAPVKSAVETQSPSDNEVVKAAKAEVPVSQKENEDEDDWLSGALSRKRALSGSRQGSRTQIITQEDKMEVTKKADVDLNISKQVTSHTPRMREDSALSVRNSPSEPGPVAHSTPIKDDTTKHGDKTIKELQTAPAPVQPQITLSADNLQMLLQQQMTQPPLLSLGGHVSAGAQPFADPQSWQARVVQLEGQVKTLQMERDQSQLLLENLQLRHKQDMELMENAHKARVKMLEESAAQRETRLRQECEDLMERLAALTRSTEQERSELQAQYQRKLSQAQQERDREVERLRELQRKSILEMKKDHEDQIHRLKKLKDEEIDAVTSATSQTRSLSVVIEQMEQFSSRLGELSCRVESSHENTAQGLEQGARHRDEQLRILQDRLAQQQKAMSEEKAYLKEIISRMDTQISEQQRQLEKERWRVTSEQAKAESTQRALEDERRSLSMQMNMEREELERAKSALLEEQKSVMQHCAEERRRLAAEWASFHAQEKQRHDRAQREVSSLLERREGSIISMAQEQADLKLRTAELKQKELAVAQERENLDRLREELEREKERISTTALRLKTRAQEVEAFSKLAADKFEEGEQALHQAKVVEAEHEARLRNIHSQTEKLRQQEQRILQERMYLTNLQKEQPRPAIPTYPSMPPVLAPVPPDLMPVVPSSKLAPTLNILPNTFANSQSMALQASLALWKYTAEKVCHLHTKLRFTTFM